MALNDCRAMLPLVVLLLGLSSASAQTKVTSVIHRTSATGAACGPANVNCNGGWHRTMAGNVPTNVSGIPKT